jgi:hypothetical protein
MGKNVQHKARQKASRAKPGETVQRNAMRKRPGRSRVKTPSVRPAENAQRKARQLPLELVILSAAKDLLLDFVILSAAKDLLLEFVILAKRRICFWQVSTRKLRPYQDVPSEGPSPVLYQSAFRRCQRDRRGAKAFGTKPSQKASK